MNLALQPRNLTAKVVLVAGCLHVSIKADRLLKQATLINFTREGLLRLGSNSIQCVRVYGLKNGQDFPIWSEEFVVNPSEVTSVNSDDLDTNDATQATSQNATYSQTVTRLLPIDPTKCLMAVSAIAFLSGGTIALVSRFSRLERVTASPDVEQRRHQFEAKQYLRKMNLAQQAFYKQHQRFAASLEELERSASILSQSYHYTYKLTLPTKTQSQITAIAKTEGLNSYTAAVFVAPGGASEATITTVCETQQPSKTPPIPQLNGTTAECAAPSRAL